MGNALPLRSNEPIPYPFETQLRLDANMKARERRLRNFPIVTPIYADKEYFDKTLHIYDDLVAYFVPSGLGFVFGDDPGVFEKVVKEFAYSFVPKWGVTEEDVNIRYVREWTFRLGGRDFTVEAEDLRIAYGLENRNGCKPAPKELKLQLWQMITKSDKAHKAGATATQIKVPIWKFIHRLIATIIYLRKDKGRFVTADDMELMTCLYGHIEIDPLCCITKSLEESHLTSFRGHYISGGHFVSIIARFVGFSLNPTRALPKEVLGESELLARWLIKRVKLHGHWVIRLTDRYYSPPAASPRPSTRQERGEPSTTHHESSDYGEVLRRLDALSTSTREIAAWQNDMSSWQDSMTTWHGDMMRGLYTHMGYPGYTSPPRPSFHHSSPRDDFPPRDDIRTDQGADATFAHANDDDDDDDDSGSDPFDSPSQYQVYFHDRRDD